VQEAMPILVMLGVVMLALILLLLGIVTRGRSGKAHEPVNTMPDASPLTQASQGVASSPSPSEPIRIFLDPGGAATLEIEGRRFSQMSDIGDERLAQRALAALGALQRFSGTPALRVGYTPQGCPGDNAAGAHLHCAQAQVSVTPLRQTLALNDELRAGHTPADGELVIEFQGQRFRRLTDVRDAETGRRLLALLSELAKFSQGLAVPLAKSAEPAPLSEDKFLGQLVASPSEPAPIKIPSLVESLRGPARKPGPMPVGIAGLVEQVLQQQLVDNSALLGRSIHIVTARDGSLNVQVEGQLLHWPDGVSELAVREAVLKAVRTWEANAGR